MQPMEDQGLQTICLYCIFAKWHDKEQIDCHAKVLNKFTSTSYSIGCDVGKGLDKSYYIIHDRVCLYNRPEEWRKHHGSLPLPDLLKLVRKEISIKVTALIYYDTSQKIEDVAYSFDTLENGGVIPSEIIVLHNRPLVQPHKTIKQIHEVSGSIPYRIEFIQEANADFYRCFDIGLKKAKYTFTASFHAGRPITNNFLSRLDIVLNDNMNKFVLVKPTHKDGHQLVVQTMIGRIVGGNNPVFDGKQIFLDNIIGKIEYLAEKQECQNMII